jgi:hypothetical protein
LARKVKAMKTGEEKIDDDVKAHREERQKNGVESESEKQNRHLKEMDGETLFAMRGESIEGVVYAAFDHQRLAKYLLAEWGEDIGPGPDHAGESASEVAMKLLDELKKRRLADG